MHTHYRHLPDEFDDYVANPKPNGYQSIHTVVLGPGGKPVEIQIRTEDMDIVAEGIVLNFMRARGGKHSYYYYYHGGYYGRKGVYGAPGGGRK